MILQAVPTPRFLRRTALREGEQNTNFLMTDRDVVAALTSPEADQVTPLMSKIYLRLKLAPKDYWEREGVLYFGAEEREGRPVKAWAVLCEIVGVASATASKALRWMHEVGIIGYFAGKNGVGIRIFLNRASSSIALRPAPAGQKNLNFSPASSRKPPASQNEPAFNDSFADSEVSDTDYESPAPKNGAAAQNGILRESPAPTPAPDAETLVAQILGAIEPFVAEVVTREGQRTFARIREWLERSGIPKATRVAVHEGFKVVARGEGREGKRRRHEEWVEVGRAETGPAETGPLSPEEVEMYARMCLELEARTGQMTEATLAELAAEAGGPILPEDAPRVRELIEGLRSGPGAAVIEAPARPAGQEREDPEEAYRCYLESALEERLSRIEPDEWESLIEAEREVLLKENPSSRIFHGSTLKGILESRVMKNLRESLAVKSFEEFVSEV